MTTDDDAINAVLRAVRECHDTHDQRWMLARGCPDVREAIRKFGELERARGALDAINATPYAKWGSLVGQRKECEAALQAAEQEMG